MAIVSVAIDLEKNAFAVHGVDESGKPALVRPSVPRVKLLEFIASSPPCLIGMEARSSAHQWAREFQKFWPHRALADWLNPTPCDPPAATRRLQHLGSIYSGSHLIASSPGLFNKRIRSRLRAIYAYALCALLTEEDITNCRCSQQHSRPDG